MWKILVVIAIITCIPFLRCVINNLHYIGIYTFKDIYNYLKYKKYNDFNYFGIDMFVAMFGKGKTLSMTHRARKLYEKYGDSITFISNYKLVDIPYIELENFNQLVDLGEDYEEGKKGTVVLIDEISSVLSHRNFSKFPIELIGLLCQQRKKRVYIMCTAQRYFMVDKIFRSLCTNVVDCNKLWRFQHNTVYDAWEYEQATSSNLLRKITHNWWFVKNEDYQSYDTSEMISKNKATDFLSNEETLIRKCLDNSVITNELGVKKPSRKLRKYLKR